LEALYTNPSDTTHFFLYLLREKVAELLVRALASLSLTDRKRLLLLLSLKNMIRPASLHFLQTLLIRTIIYKGAETIVGIWEVIKCFR
jgi:non-homologous end joining protein Ku